ncbi:hypothetical protein [Bacillus sp. NPDC077027]|uniref:hypothetical protein n=1 Tax=Bacillus sp. NPDC077027 TaxID=3390548 RepID=UPI003D01A0A9
MVNFGDIIFQIISFLGLAFIISVIVITFRSIRKKQADVKKIEDRLNNVIEKNHLHE